MYCAGLRVAGHRANELVLVTRVEATSPHGNYNSADFATTVACF